MLEAKFPKRLNEFSARIRMPVRLKDGCRFGKEGWTLEEERAAPIELRFARAHFSVFLLHMTDLSLVKRTGRYGLLRRVIGGDARGKYVVPRNY